MTFNCAPLAQKNMQQVKKSNPTKLMSDQNFITDFIPKTHWEKARRVNRGGTVILP